MREIIDELLAGKFEYGDRKLGFSVDRIEISVFQGQKAEGSFTIYGPKNSAVFGQVTSSELRMHVISGSFSGSSDTVSYSFDTTGLDEGDVILGNFRIISNQGEYLLPFTINIEYEHISSSMGEIRNLFHFTNLAKSSWQEAVAMFYTKDFYKIFRGADAQFEGLYRGLCVSKGNERNVDEFLQAVNKKTPVSFIFDKTDLQIDMPSGMNQFQIEITKNGWGYADLNVVTSGNFVQCGATHIFNEDFNGTVCRVNFRIDESYLHAGNNYGEIRFSNTYTDVAVPITVNFHTDAPSLTTDYLEKKRLKLELVRSYEDYRCKKKNMKTWLTETGTIIKKMTILDEEDPEFQLYEAHYLITASRVNQALWILEKLKLRVNSMDDSMYGYYLYLGSLCGLADSYAGDIEGKIRDLYMRDRENWRLSWILQFVSEEYSTNARRVMDMLSDQFDYGCRSPILYLEALRIMNDSPAIVTRLDVFEQTVLEYGAKKQAISPLLCDQVVYLSARSKIYSKKILTILQYCYQIKKSNDCLEAICSMLIKGECTDKMAFEWYAKGVEAELRLTRLYEYYMMSIYTDENGLLPCELSKMVLLYFSYQSNLEYEKSAILYRYVTEHKDQSQQIYEAYLPQIERFVMDMIDKGRVSQDLAFLYKEYISQRMIDNTNSGKLLAIINTYLLTVEQPNITTVCIIYDKCEREIQYPVVDGKAYIALYGSAYTLVFMDKSGNRYAGSVKYTKNLLQIYEELSDAVESYIQSGEENLDLFLCQLGKEAFSINLDNASRYKDLSDNINVRKSCREQIKEELIRFYYDNDFTRQLSDMILEENPAELSDAQRAHVLEIMTLTGLYDEALSILHDFGTYKIDAGIIVRLFDRLADSDKLTGSAADTTIAYYAYKNGKYDDLLLKFLVDHFNGTVKELRDLWKSAVSFGIDTTDLCEKILLRILGSGSYIGEQTKVFESYVQNGGDEELIEAYVSQKAYDYVVKDTVTDEYIFDQIARLATSGHKLLKVCKIAYLRYYADTVSSRNSDQFRDVASAFMKDLVTQNIYFPFYQDYSPYIDEASQYSDKTMIMHRAKPHSRCILHYALPGDASGEYRTLQMREMYDGIYVSSFVLFFGEQIQYYITERNELVGTDDSTMSGTMQKSDIGRDGGNERYKLINDIMIAETLQDYDTAAKLLHDYYNKRALGSRLFRPLKYDGEANK